MSQYRIAALLPSPPGLEAIFLMNVDACGEAWQGIPVVSLAIVEWQDTGGFHSEVDGIVAMDKLRPARFHGTLVGYRMPNDGVDWDEMASTMRLAIERGRRLDEEHRQPHDMDPTIAAAHDWIPGPLVGTEFDSISRGVDDAGTVIDPDGPIGRPGPPPVPPEKKDDDDKGSEGEA